MHGFLRWSAAGTIAALGFAAAPLAAQQPTDTFHWMDFHAPHDQDVVSWVTRSLAAEKWTAIREIGVLYDAALVATTLRPTAQSPANADTFTIWSVSLTSHAIAPLVRGSNLRWLDWMRFSEGGQNEPAILYDNCTACAADSFFTAFHYDLSQHLWTARWMRGGRAAPIWSANPPAGFVLTQVYAVMTDSNGRGLLGTWSHFDYGKQRPAEDFIYRYDLDPSSGLERTQRLSAKDAEAMKQRLCGAQNAVPGLARGQNSLLCLEILKPLPARKPVTTPPAGNRGQSVPPGSRH